MHRVKITTPEKLIPKVSVSGAQADIMTARGLRTFKVTRQGAPENSHYLIHHGCSVCSLTTILNNYTEKYRDYTAQQVHDEVEKAILGFVSPVMPVTLYGISKILKENGIPCTYIDIYKRKEAYVDILTHLYSGRPVLLITKNRNLISGEVDHKWAGSVHCMPLLGMTDTGKVIVADSANRAWAGEYQRFKLGDLKDLLRHAFSSRCHLHTNYWSGMPFCGGYIKIEK